MIAACESGSGAWVGGQVPMNGRGSGGSKFLSSKSGRAGGKLDPHEGDSQEL